jgi:DNA-binding transcriptional ArsR family regulator
LTLILEWPHREGADGPLPLAARTHAQRSGVRTPVTVRIHFTARDLARTPVAPVGPLDETACAIWLLQRREGRLLFDGWRRQKLARLTPAARRLGALIPAVSCVSLDVFTLSGGPSDSLDHALQNLRSCPARHVAHEARFADQSRPLQSWTRGLTDGDAAARDLLDESLRAAYQVCVAPHWRQITTYYAVRRGELSQVFIEGGLDLLLGSLHPSIRWRPPVLELPTPSSTATSGDRYLDGRGIILAPAFFDLVPRVTWNLADPAAPPVLHIPPVDLPTRLRTICSVPGPEDLTARHLAGLMGRTRAMVLQRIAYGASTSEIARSEGISAANASEHATTLRLAGLVTSDRRRNTVQHSLTPLGLELLTAADSA